MSGRRIWIMTIYLTLQKNRRKDENRKKREKRRNMSWKNKGDKESLSDSFRIHGTKHTMNMMAEECTNSTSDPPRTRLEGRQERDVEIKNIKWIPMDTFASDYQMGFGDIQYSPIALSRFWYTTGRGDTKISLFCPFFFMSLRIAALKELQDPEKERNKHEPREEEVTS